LDARADDHEFDPVAMVGLQQKFGRAQIMLGQERLRSVACGRSLSPTAIAVNQVVQRRDAFLPEKVA
jgi:hypothetical protein